MPFRDPKSPVLLGWLLLLTAAAFLRPQAGGKESALDAKVRAFLDRMRYQWGDMNVPESDGQLLYDIILKNGFQRALELGTSTGHSGTWMAWALSQTGGKLTTIEIDERRHREALANFEEAGLSGRVDARLADAHEFVEEVKGPFDFVFIDADKDWYVNYAKALIPKLAAGGCIAAHNVSPPRSGRYGGYGRYGSGGYYEFMAGLREFETSMLTPRSSISVSYKKKGN